MKHTIALNAVNFMTIAAHCTTELGLVMLSHLFVINVINVINKHFFDCIKYIYLN